MIVGLLAGASFGLGAWMTLRGLWPPRPALVDAISALDRPFVQSDSSHQMWRSRINKIALALGDFAGGESKALRADLNIMELTALRYGVSRLTLAIFGSALPLVMVLIVASGTGALVVSPLLVVIASIGFAIGGFFIPVIDLRTKAAQRRDDFIHALCAYLDSVGLSLAGGAGIEQALADAANQGEGWAFARLRGALANQQHGPPWDRLDRLANVMDSKALGEVAGSLALGGESGAKIRVALSAQTMMLRDQQLADALSKAETASEKMGGPVVAMMLGFILLIGYPAIANVMSL